MESMALILKQKMLKQRLDLPFQEKIKTMDRVAITQDQKIVETMARFSI